MEIQKSDQYFAPGGNHDDSVAVQGLEDLFQWASDTMAEGLDGKTRRIRDQQMKRQVLNVIHRTADLQAKAKHADEMAYLHRRVIALQGVVSEHKEEIGNLKQIVVSQYCAMQRIPELEEKIVQLESRASLVEQAEEDRKHLMNALAKLKKERDYLEELVTVNETENSRLAKLLTDTRDELTTLKNRRWWQLFFPVKKK